MRPPKLKRSPCGPTWHQWLWHFKVKKVWWQNKFCNVSTVPRSLKDLWVLKRGPIFLSDRDPSLQKRHHKVYALLDTSERRADMLTSWHVDKLTCWQADILTSWHVDKLTYWQADKLTCWQAVMLTNWHVDNVNLTCWQADMLTCWQADMLTCWHVDMLTCCQKLLNVAQKCQRLPQVAIS